MKITIYELLGLIKEGKAPKKIRLEDYILELKNQCYWKYKYADCQGDYLFIDYNIKLNDEVEIIEEEKEIEEFEYRRIDKYKSCQNGMTKDDREHLDSDFEDIFTKINVLIDEVNKLKSGKNE